MQGKEMEGAGVKRGGDGISLRELPGGKWEARWWNDGKWVRRRAASKDAAEALAQEERERRAAAAKAREKEAAIERRAAARGDLIVGILNMDIESRQALMLAVAKMKAAGGRASDLPLAVDEYVAAHLAEGRIPLADAVEAHKRWLEEAGRSGRTVYERKRLLGIMVGEIGGETAVAAVAKSAIADWIDGAPPASRPHRYRAASAFFRWAFGRGMVGANPMEGMNPPPVPPANPRILSPDEVRRLLDAALRHRPDTVLYFAVGIFAGLRPERELGGLVWEDIDLAERKIFVPWGRVKTGRSRAVPISENLAAWLEMVPEAERKGRVHRISQRAFNFVVKKSGVEWQDDIMRHSRVSYRLAQTGGDVALCVLEGGHSAAILAKHYTNMRIRREDVEAFWRIVPPKAGLKG